MQFLVMLVALAACTGSEGGSPPGVVTDPLTGARSMELTEPWKSMNLPIDGAVVDASTEHSVLLRFPAIAEADASTTYAALRQSLLDAGWQVEADDAFPTSRQAAMRTPAGNPALLSVFVESGRPAAQITIAR